MFSMYQKSFTTPGRQCSAVVDAEDFSAERVLVEGLTPGTSGSVLSVTSFHFE